MSSKIRAVIVDDEPLAREGIRSLLEGDSSVRIVGECRDGFEAIRFLEHHATDILFLDIQMPEMNGFELLEAISSPAITIFTTAYDKYAVEAFAVHAFDYLLKPIDPDRFTNALARAKSAIGQEKKSADNARLSALLSAMRSHEGRPERLLVKSSGRIHFLELTEIDWVEAAGDYVFLHVRRKKYIHREKMHALESRLARGTFCRIHRSTIVNAERIRDLEPLPHGDAIAHLRDGTRLNVSRTHRQELIDHIR